MKKKNRRKFHLHSDDERETHWFRFRFHDDEHANLLNSMWLIAITFLSVGFGDIVPNTYCGRGIAVSTGIMVSWTFISDERRTTANNPTRMYKDIDERNFFPQFSAFWIFKINFSPLLSSQGCWLHGVPRCAFVEKIGIDKSWKARSQFHDGYSANEAGESRAKVESLMNFANVVIEFVHAKNLFYWHWRVINRFLTLHLTFQLKNAAANVLRETWLIYKHTRLVKRVNPGRVRTHQRKFLLAIYA
jgi:hypothetical protein